MNMTSEGKIEYVVDTEEVVPGVVEFKDIHDNISSIEFEATDSQLIMRFHTLGIFAEDDDIPLNNIALRIIISRSI